ncbi:MAG: DNA repair and recombination protein RadB [Candidatus Woesearchaeota archaeon]
MQDTLKISSGNEPIDALLKGGFETDVLTTIFGPAGSGKTNVALCALAHILKKDKKAIYIDTEGSFSSDRMLQIFPEFNAYAANLLFLKPTNFSEQKDAFEVLHKTVNIERKPCDLIVIDSIAMLYRLEIGQTQDVYAINRELGRQLGMLTELARKRNIPILITNQVYADFESDAVKMVGGDLLKYSSKCLIELQKKEDVREAVLKKHRSIPENEKVSFKIVSKGIDYA